MSVDSTPSPSALPPPRRSAWILIISVIILCASAFRLFAIAMVPSLISASADTSTAQREFLESQTLFNYILAVVSTLGNVIAAVLLLLMKRQALPVFIAAFLLALLNTIYNIVANNWLTTVGGTGLIVPIIGWVVNIAIVVYVWSLFRKGFLR